MSRRSSGSLILAATVLLAAGLWFITFALKGPSFWVKISISAATLALLSLLLDPPQQRGGSFEARTWLIGLGSAAALYLIFWIGRTVSLALFDFAGDQIGAIYQKGEGTPVWLIALLLFFVTGPCEEIYWRGYLQRRLMARCGRWPGWALATALYAGVHLSAMNFMLVGAAAVAGAFWGAIYAQGGRLAPVILSHAVWSTVIFAVFPLR